MLEAAAQHLQRGRRHILRPTDESEWVRECVFDRKINTSACSRDSITTATDGGEKEWINQWNEWKKGKNPNVFITI